MIAFLGLSPAWQTVYRMATLDRGGVTRAAAVRRFASGKATNAAAECRRHADAVAVATVVGGAVGSLYEADLFRLRLRLILARGAGTRGCTTVVEDGAATELVEEAAAESPAVAEELLRGVRRLAPKVVCGCGSLPAGVGDDVYARMVRGAGGAVTVVDAAGAALRLACEAGVTVAKPNRSELAATVGHDGVEAGAAELRELGAEWVLVTDGPRPALLLGESAEWLEPPAAEVVSPIGAGDVLCGRMAAALAEGADVPEAARLGVGAAVEHCGRDVSAS